MTMERLRRRAVAVEMRIAACKGDVEKDTSPIINHNGETLFRLG
jgi:hypothetical protein